MPNRYKSIDGWFDSGIARIYDKIVDECKEGDIIVEIGSWKGASSCYLLEKIEESNKTPVVYFIDLWSGCAFGSSHEQTAEGVPTGFKVGSMEQEFRDNLKGQGFPDVNSIASDSHSAASRFGDNSIFAVFFDGNHQEGYCRKEIEIWKPKVKLGGIMAGHDYPEMRFVNDLYPNIEDCGSCYFWRKQ